MPEATKTVLLRCKLKRAGGTKIENLFGKNYHFKPAEGDKSEAPDHVCAIPFDDAQAIHRLLRIKEAYELVDADAELPAAPAAATNTQTIANDRANPNGPKPIIIKDGDGNEFDLTNMPLEEIRQFAKDQFGITCHHKWNKETVATKIMEKLREE